MTADQSNLLANLETKVRYLLSLYGDLKKEKEKSDDELKQVRAVLSETENRAKEWERQYKNLKLAKTLSMSGQEAKETENRLSKLEREIEKCIALLNE